MLEVLHRAGCGRMTRWSRGTSQVTTPDILFFSSEKLPAPGFAELIVEDKREGEPFELRIVSSPEIQSILIPNDLKIPLSFLRREKISSTISSAESVVVRGDVMNVASQLEGIDSSIYVLGNAFELRRDAREFVKSLVALRSAVGSGRLIYAPGILDVSNLALLCYAGVDLFDSSLLVYQGSRGRLLTPEGTLMSEEAKWLVNSSDPEESIRHNLEAAWSELQLVRHMLKLGRLRELVEMRVNSSPWSVAALRILDLEFFELQEMFTPVVGPSFYCNSKQSLYRPDVQRFRLRILERYIRPAHKRVLLLIPCSAKKPYSMSRSHRLFFQAMQAAKNNTVVHEVAVTSPLGVVPRELELFYPAAEYDIPVTGHWDNDEKAMVQEMVVKIAGFGYDKIISHLSSEESFVKDVVDCVDTSSGRPTSNEALEKLSSELSSICSSFPYVSRGEDRVGNMESLARFQFGEGGEVLVEDCSVVGNYPYLRILHKKLQTAMLTPERGMLSLTMQGGEKLLPTHLNIVQMANFELKGNLFAIGVEDADRRIRSGDEVLVLNNGELEAVGVASMCGEEMMNAERGEAVKIRHRRSRS